MSGDDLLNERCARARHADDKHRRAGAIPITAFRPQKIGVEDITYTLHVAERFSLAISDLRPLERVAGEQMLKRSVVLFEIGIGLAQRKLQVDPLGHRYQISRQLLHDRELRVVGLETLGMRKVSVVDGSRGINLNRLLIRIARRIEIATL